MTFQNLRVFGSGFVNFWVLGLRPIKPILSGRNLLLRGPICNLVDVKGPIYFPDAELCTELAEHEYQYDKMQELWFIDTLNMVVHYRNDLVTRVIISDIMAST